MINGIVVPVGYTYDEWDETSHADRIVALRQYSKTITSYTMIGQIKDDIEYYLNIKKQINAMIGGY